MMRNLSSLSRLMHGEFYIAMFQVPNHEDAEKIVRDAAPHITAAAEAIKDNIAFPKTKNNMVYRLMSSAVNPVFYPLFVSAKKIHGRQPLYRVLYTLHGMYLLLFAGGNRVRQQKRGKAKILFRFFQFKIKCGQKIMGN